MSLNDETFELKEADSATTRDYQHRFGLVVKKTFLELEDRDVPCGAVRRVRSVDKFFRYGGMSEESCTDDTTVASTPGDESESEMRAVSCNSPSVPQRDDYAKMPSDGHFDSGRSTSTSDASSELSLSSFSETVVESSNGFEKEATDTWFLGRDSSEADTLIPLRYRPQVFAPPKRLRKRAHISEKHMPWSARQCMADRLRSATTVMVHNLPKGINQPQFARLIGCPSFGFENLYDFLYVPASLNTGIPSGYAFVNLLSPELAVKFAIACERNSMHCSRASIQGRDANWHDMQRRIKRVRNQRFLPIFIPSEAADAVCS